MIHGFIFQPHAVKTFALVGPSGTGKSFQAKFVARKKRIDFIIDDGLLIRHTRILAGHSAKEEKSFIAAVKAALFDDKSRRDEVARVLQAERYKRILILGTSEKMVNKIAARLQLPLPSKIIRIEDVSSQKDIENARRIRAVEGKHVIPVPGVEVKRAYPGIFLEVIRIFRKKMVSGALTVPESHEKSVVTPLYSRPNNLFISPGALSLMVQNCVDEYNMKFKARTIEIKSADGVLGGGSLAGGSLGGGSLGGGGLAGGGAGEGGSTIGNVVQTGYHVIITLDIPVGTQLENTITGLRSYIVENIEHFTGILVAEVNIVIDKLLEM